jgi:cobyrinic acid a,c-diamide synthase
VVAALPRIVVAAPASGHGKTTVATGIMAALRRRGHTVSGHKVGPDYIDPGYHALATDRPGRNLDPYLVGEERLVPLLLHGAHGADVAVIEGVMGLYDGQLGGDGFASTAHVAAVTATPVVLVVDVSRASRSIAAVVHGMRTFDSSIRIVGVVLNKAGSPRHAREVLDALAATGLPVLGVLQRDDGIVVPSRHLGLVPAAERGGAAVELDRLAERIHTHLDLDQLLDLARAATDLDAQPWEATAQVTPTGGPRPLVAMAGGRAFTFRYAETEELLRAAGCDTVTFDPLVDDDLPAGARALYLGGGFPEVYASQLSANLRLRKELLDAVSSGMPTIAECAGLLYLCRTLDGHPMIGALGADATMTPRLTLGYRAAIVATDQLTGAAGSRVHGHEFHRTITTPVSGPKPAYIVDGRAEGFGSATLSASYLHLHWAGQPHLAERLAQAARAFALAPAATPHLPATAPTLAVTVESEMPADPLRHHGDRELGAGRVDFAVNVYAEGPPRWLLEALRASLDRVDKYPDPTSAEQALAALHRRDRDEIIATAGAAEAFTLIARARPWRHPVVVHPQFTEPDVALLAAGRNATRVIGRAEHHFALPVEQIPTEADLVIVGNPTNPTAVLHSRDTIRSLMAPGRTVVVDEAFLDAVPGEPESLAGTRIEGLLVVRSLTKLWAIPGVRAGYVVGDAALITALRRQQPPWSVSTTAAMAIIATSTAEAAAERARRAHILARDRAHLAAGLDRVGIPHVPGAGAFVLAQVPLGTHARLSRAGFAVRRCDTFPGLDDGWIRIAVRPPAHTDPLLASLARSGGGPGGPGGSSVKCGAAVDKVSEHAGSVNANPGQGSR